MTIEEQNVTAQDVQPETQAQGEPDSVESAPEESPTALGAEGGDESSEGESATAPSADSSISQESQDTTSVSPEEGNDSSTEESASSGLTENEE